MPRAASRFSIRAPTPGAPAAAAAPAAARRAGPTIWPDAWLTSKATSPAIVANNTFRNIFTLLFWHGCRPDSSRDQGALIIWGRYEHFTCHFSAGSESLSMHDTLATFSV